MAQLMVVEDKGMRELSMQTQPHPQNLIYFNAEWSIQNWSTGRGYVDEANTNLGNPGWCQSAPCSIIPTYIIGEQIKSINTATTVICILLPLSWCQSCCGYLWQRSVMIQWCTTCWTQCGTPCPSVQDNVSVVYHHCSSDHQCRWNQHHSIHQDLCLSMPVCMYL